MTTHWQGLPTRLRDALESLRNPQVRPQVSLQEIPGPTRIAPYSVALEGSVTLDGHERSQGRFVVLFDPQGHEAWQGDFRVIAMCKALVESEFGGDPMLDEVAWTWLTEALHASTGDVHALGGTVTRVLSTQCGVLANAPAGPTQSSSSDLGTRAEITSDDHWGTAVLGLPSVDIEIRASWTPTDTNLGAHLRAWAQLMCTAGGLEPLPDGVTALHSYRPQASPFAAVR